MKKKILYTDVPRPYDRDAERLLKVIGFIFGLCLLSVAILAFMPH